MQEDIENRTVTLIINTAKLTERELKQAILKFLALVKNKVKAKTTAQPHGKMTVKQLKGMQSIEVTDKNIGSFTRVARKYGIDFAPFKVKGEDRYLVFFKAPDSDAMTAAFKEYTARELNKTKRPSLLEHLRQLEKMIAHPVKSKERRKEPER